MLRRTISNYAIIFRSFLEFKAKINTQDTEVTSLDKFIVLKKYRVPVCKTQHKISLHFVT